MEVGISKIMLIFFVCLCTQVLQWYWFGAGQTYESCVDFVVQDAAPVHEHSGMIRGRSWRG